MYNGPEEGCRKALDPLFGLLPNESYRDIWQAGSYREIERLSSELPDGVNGERAAFGALAGQVSYPCPQPDCGGVGTDYRAVPGFAQSE
jgi:hypothetical protein